MAIITLPTSFRPVGFSFGQQRHDFMERSAATGQEAARLLAPPHWTCGVQSAEHMTLSEAGTWEAWLLKLRGGVNVAAIYDPIRRQPEGTLRGSPVIGVAAAAGATSVTIGNAIGTNLLQYPSSYNHAYWSRSNVNVTSNATTAWDGSTKADRIEENTTSSTTHSISGPAITSDPTITHTSSLVAKADTIRYIRLHVQSGANSANHCRAVFDLQTGAVTETVNAGTGTGGSASIESLGSGWYRCKISGKPDTSGTTVRLSFLTMPASSGTAIYASATGTDGFWASDAMIEVGASATDLSSSRPTLKAGDWLQFGTGLGTSQTVKVTDNADGSAFSEAVWSTGGGAQAIWSTTGGQALWTDDGVPSNAITVTFEPPLRTAFAKDTAVTWDKPVAYYRMQGNPKWQYSTRSYRREGGFAADFVETFN